MQVPSTGPVENHGVNILHSRGGGSDPGAEGSLCSLIYHPSILSEKRSMHRILARMQHLTKHIIQVHHGWVLHLLVEKQRCSVDEIAGCQHTLCSLVRLPKGKVQRQFDICGLNHIWFKP